MVKAWAEQYNAKMKPITEAQKRFHARKSVKYLFIDNKNGDCTCPSCGKELHLGKIKHKSQLICPKCKKNLIVQHTWRASKYLEVINWMVIPKAINDHVLCLRYVLAYQKGNAPMEVYEAARMFIDENHVDPEYYCGRDKEWHRGKQPYFRHDCILNPNKFECYYAYEYGRNFIKEIDKLDCFKYYSSANDYSKKVIPSQLIYMVHAARINEKLSKIGITDVNAEHRHYFCTHHDRVLPFNYKERSLKKMLGLDQMKFNLLREFPSMNFLFWLRRRQNVNYEQMREAKGDVILYDYVHNKMKEIGVSFGRLARYLEGKNLSEYTHYLYLLGELGYNVKDTYYSMPSDFRKADERVTKELEDKKRKIAEEKDMLIKDISDGIRAMPNLKEFLEGSKGLLVYVPESSEDLVQAGREMHCCLGTYPERIAEGKTLVFFVRKLDNPTAQFVAFEYCNGEVVQCRYAHNKDVKDTQILDFVNRFADALKKSA